MPQTLAQWFSWYVPGSDKDVQPLQQTQLYTEVPAASSPVCLSPGTTDASGQDWLGLQAMDQQGKLHFLRTLGDHLQFTGETPDGIPGRHSSLTVLRRRVVLRQHRDALPEQHDGLRECYCYHSWWNERNALWNIA